MVSFYSAKALAGSYHSVFIVKSDYSAALLLACDNTVKSAAVNGSFVNACNASAFLCRA